MKRMHVFLPPKLHATLRAIADDKGVTFGEVLRRAADDYVAKAKRQARAAAQEPQNETAAPQNQ